MSRDLMRRSCGEITAEFPFQQEDKAALSLPSPGLAAYAAHNPHSVTWLGHECTLAAGMLRQRWKSALVVRRDFAIMRSPFRN
jgi:hypothetical protein